MNGENRKNIKRGLLHKLYFLAPKQNADCDLLAEKLINLKLVEEVFLTGNDFGFVVRARFFSGKEPKNIKTYISRKISSRYGKIVSY